MSILETVTLPTPTRREFCTQACRILSVVAAGTVLDGCGSGSSPTSPTAGSGSSLPVANGVLANGTVTVTIDANSPLAATGGMALVQTSGNPLLVARTAQDSFTAHSAICTHERCTITGFSNQLFVCPCHGSEFDTSGNVVRGPAAVPLTGYSTQFANGTLTITG
jgi:cytochrome b6-f complex iron-sulfur subunit